MVIAIKVERNFQYRGECVYNITLMTFSSLSEKNQYIIWKLFVWIILGEKDSILWEKILWWICVIFWGFATSRREAKKVFFFYACGWKGTHIWKRNIELGKKTRCVFFSGEFFYWRFKEQGLQTILQLSENNKRGKTKQKNEIWGHISGFLKEESSDVQFLSWKRKKIFV